MQDRLVLPLDASTSESWPDLSFSFFDSRLAAMPCPGQVGANWQCGNGSVGTTAMNMFDLAKATVVCAGLGFLIYSFPLISQVSLIAILGILWLGYARKALVGLRRR